MHARACLRLLFVIVIAHGWNGTESASADCSRRPGGHDNSDRRFFSRAPVLRQGMDLRGAPSE
jgi:hypothetical protein